MQTTERSRLVKIARWILGLAFFALLAAYIFDTSGVLSAGRRPYYPLLSIAIAFILLDRLGQPLQLPANFKNRPPKSRTEVIILASLFIFLGIALAAFFIFWPKTY